MAPPSRLKDRLFSGLCVLAAFGVLVLGLSRGNPKVGFIGAGLFLGYAALHAVTRRLLPAARLLSGTEADRRQRRAHYQATRTAGQVGLVVAAAGVLLALSRDWAPGLWVAGTSILLMASFGLVLWLAGRPDSGTPDQPAPGP